MPSKKHIHTYERRKTPKGASDKQIYYRCLDPECSHRIVREDLFGKRAQCPYCGELYILNPRTLRLKLPHCGCSGLEVKPAIDTDELMEKILKLQQEKFNRDALSE
jgi:DNA-directed RNA polymerase subunit RPC12/RpoP